MRWKYPSSQLGVLLLQFAVLIFLVLPFVAPAFRDNDQATILSGSWQIAQSKASFVGASFYNFDKQWGVYLLLSWLFRLLPNASPLLVGNILLTAVCTLAWIVLGVHVARKYLKPFPLLLPVLLSPVLILYMPFLGTGWFSLAFLLLAFCFLENHRSRASRVLGVTFVAIAAACRGDVILAVPALILAEVPRASLAGLLRRPLLWSLALAACLPVLLGKLLAGVTIPDTNPLSFDARSFFGFLLFGLTPAAFLALIWAVTALFGFGRIKSRFRLFYFLSAIALLVPLGFYSLQLYTLRYLFLTLAALLFAIGSRRGLFIYRAPQHASVFGAFLVVGAIAPWIIGVQVPLLNSPRLTYSNPSRFPTGDGEFPMFGYLGFDWQVLFRDHFAIDHNQRIWLAARSTNYQPCPNGAVPFLLTPMSNFIDFAIRSQGKTPLPIDYLAQSPCGVAYVDARTILRGIRPDPRDGAFFQNGMRFVSSIDNGELIVRVDEKAPQSNETRILEGVRKTLGLRYAEVHLRSPSCIPVTPGLRYAVFSPVLCRSSDEIIIASDGTNLIQSAWTGSKKGIAHVTCPAAPLNGWAQTVYPPYMGM